MRLRRRQIIITGVGIDILASPVSLWFTRQILSAAQFVAVRDPFSLAYLGHLPSEDVRLAADLVLAGHIQIPMNGRVRTSDRKVIGVCFVDYFRTLEISPTKHQMYFERIAECLRRYQDRFDFCCVAFQEGVGQRDDWLYREHQGIFPALSYKHIASLEDLAFLREEIDLVLTTRFHLGLLGCLLGKPVAVVSHELKLAAQALHLSLPIVFMEEFIGGEGFDLVEALERIDGADIAGRLEWQRKRAQLNFDWLPQ